ncbi:hypothetical protein L6452_31750 [Arctium lappa]|uniref:Uncharacterized protein n=1 Tax=Arctium lappa TaxID=4217 RepID=A0ACB8Z328_ARCLA|nr:hypothetical protein L6452_31750 [Arctium lappa]
MDKDEALRAKRLAEEKMLKNDFEGAHKIALKAKQLFPELDNISQCELSEKTMNIMLTNLVSVLINASNTVRVPIESCTLAGLFATQFLGSSQAVLPACSIVAMAIMGLCLASFSGNGPSLLEIDHDERLADGTLASSFAVNTCDPPAVRFEDIAFFFLNCCNCNYNLYKLPPKAIVDFLHRRFKSAEFNFQNTCDGGNKFNSATEENI